jgi:hypothetical protein
MAKKFQVIVTYGSETAPLMKGYRSGAMMGSTKYALTFDTPEQAGAELGRAAGLDHSGMAQTYSFSIKAIDVPDPKVTLEFTEVEVAAMARLLGRTLPYPTREVFGAGVDVSRLYTRFSTAGNIVGASLTSTQLRSIYGL